MLFVSKYAYIVFITFILQAYNAYAMTFFLKQWIFDTWQHQRIHFYNKEQIKRQSLDLFLQKYAPPQAIIDYLNADNNAICTECFSYKFPKQIKVENKLYWIKVRKSIERIINSIRLKELIIKENLTRLDVVNKYIYYTNKKCLIIAEHAERDYAWYEYNKENDAYMPKREFFDEQIAQQLSTLVIKSGFIDWSLCQNYIIDQNKKMVFIDTEDYSFFDYKIYIKNKSYLCHAQVLSVLLSCIPFNMQNGSENFLKQYVIQELKHCEVDDGYCKANKIQILPCNSKLDPTDFDLSVIKKKLVHAKRKRSHF